VSNALVSPRRSGAPRSARERFTGPRLALRPEEAAEAIGVSRSFFFADILPELRVVRRGRVRLIQVAELEQWLERNADRLFERAV
jgi:hypothetical protein